MLAFQLLLPLTFFHALSYVFILPQWSLSSLSFHLFSLFFPGVCGEQSCHPLVSCSTLWARCETNPTRARRQWPSQLPPVAFTSCWLWQGSPLLLVHIMVHCLYSHIWSQRNVFFLTLRFSFFTAHMSELCMFMLSQHNTNTFIFLQLPLFFSISYSPFIHF